MRERRSGAERRAGLWPVALERGSADVCVCARVRMRVCVLACGVGLSGARYYSRPYLWCCIPWRAYVCEPERPRRGDGGTAHRHSTSRASGHAHTLARRRQVWSEEREGRDKARS